ncbi:carbohydrate kinase family protein [Deinococcus peraridilitoris]|uniref:Sugar kinase, ribokinase n=1 Tax=Deinococcus peraridilitoris (strain DSM 19664 / LMG 22246 / CIP 109416 / KR-200) TaxID=937777 RepID=K9ZWU4_DEIPD|nr:carbohydrate kinase [Deinococcus peraridilitoris]AFZ65639.1 sugar kinase, ribokinase [Deinococcus peraridilitoris DSM 19664]
MGASLKQVLAFGGVVMDFVQDGRGGWSVREGGSAWNVARALRALGVRTAFIGALGEDPFAAQLRRQGHAHGLDLQYSQTVRANTALSVIHRTHPPQYVFYAEHAADSQFSQMPEAAWQDVSAVYFGGITLVRQPARAAFLRYAHEARSRGLTVVYDPNFRAPEAVAYQETFEAYLQLADLVKVSHEDLAGLLPHLSPDEALAHLRARRPDATILLTLGEHGARLITRDADLHHGGYEVRVADTVGAGDASIAGLLYAVLKTDRSPPDRLAFALACGAAACTQSGAHAPSLSEIHGILQGATP